jgi:5-methyltetrahydropteroyltriglutamate--homocysteine methyltransferase
MFRASNGKPLATTITGSLPRPRWFTENLSGRQFLAVLNGAATFREQYSDAVAALIADQVRAGLDIVTDGEMRFDLDVGGRSWFGYLFDRMEGLQSGDPARGRAMGSARPGFQARANTPGDIINEFVETMMPPRVIGPLAPGPLQYDAIWKVAQRLTERPVKMGSCCGQMLDRQATNRFYKSRAESIFAFSHALNEEYHRLADAGCPVIQVEEPCLHGSGGTAGEVSFDTYIEAFNTEVRGLRAKTEVWCHTCWGNPFAQSLASRPSYRPVLHFLDRLDVDAITVEAAETRGAELADIAAAISKDKKICIGVVSHRNLQVETAEDVADLIRRALQHIEPERLLLSSDCGFGRQGMSRTHAFYKMVAIVRGANVVRRELGLPEVAATATEARFALSR